MNTRPTPGPRLTADATNRAVRTFLWALLAAVIVDLYPVLNDALNGTDPINYQAVGAAALRIAIQSALAFVVRRFADPSAIPTPLPPD